MEGHYPICQPDVANPSGRFKFFRLGSYSVKRFLSAMENMAVTTSRLHSIASFILVAIPVEDLGARLLCCLDFGDPALYPSGSQSGRYSDIMNEAPSSPQWPDRLLYGHGLSHLSLTE